MKVSKEEIVALLVALTKFANGEYLSEIAASARMLEEICETLAGAPCECQVVSAHAESIPLLEILVTERSPRSALEVCRALRQGSPPIYVSHGKLAQSRLVINPLCLDAAAAATVGRRLREALSANA